MVDADTPNSRASAARVSDPRLRMSSTWSQVSFAENENSLGYVPGNLLIVSGRANRKKGELSLEDLRTLASTRLPGYDQDDFSRIVMFYSRL